MITAAKPDLSNYNSVLLSTSWCWRDVRNIDKIELDDFKVSDDSDTLEAFIVDTKDHAVVDVG